MNKLLLKIAWWITSTPAFCANATAGVNFHAPDMQEIKALATLLHAPAIVVTWDVEMFNENTYKTGFMFQTKLIQLLNCYMKAMW